LALLIVIRWRHVILTTNKAGKFRCRSVDRVLHVISRIHKYNSAWQFLDFTRTQPAGANAVPTGDGCTCTVHLVYVY